MPFPSILHLPRSGRFTATTRARQRQSRWCLWASRFWQNTTQPFTTFDIPIYEEFFRTVRAVTQSLPHEHQIRVLLGDPPIDWDARTSRAPLIQLAVACCHGESGRGMCAATQEYNRLFLFAVHCSLYVWLIPRGWSRETAIGLTIDRRGQLRSQAFGTNSAPGLC